MGWVWTYLVVALVGGTYCCGSVGDAIVVVGVFREVVMDRIVFVAPFRVLGLPSGLVLSCRVVSSACFFPVYD
jgi:hypothetical protein